MSADPAGSPPDGTRFRVGVDIGGTFTDFTITGTDGRRLQWKESTTPDSPDTAIYAGLVEMAARLDLRLEDFLGRVELFVHGSTIATNTIIQRNGPGVGLICTGGFRDAIYFRDGFKWDRYNLLMPRPDDLIERHLRIGVRERITADGNITVRLDEGNVRQAAETFRRHDVGAVAVTLLWSHVNDAHERRVREILEDELTDVPVLLSSEILPDIGEWVRTSATVLSAYVYADSRAYMGRLRDRLSRSGLAAEPLIMQVNGGCAPIEQVLRAPVNLIHSGPAAAPVAAINAGSAVGSRDVISVDMGGTSFDVTLIKGGEIPRTRSLEVDRQPIGVPGVEVHSIGAGGGSIAWIDSGGALRVGPGSAGAVPGPAAYDTGGEEPTVTDANLVLGRLAGDSFLGGRRRLRRDLAEQAVRVRIAEPLGLGVLEAAAGIIRIVDDEMASAIRVVSVERGIDPRPFALVAGGGACALHAGRLARTLGISRVVVPGESGTLSASGMIASSVRHDYSGVSHTVSVDPDLEGVRWTLSRLEQTGRDDLRADGFPPDRIRIDRAVDARYRGQVHELTVPVPSGPVSGDLFDRVAAGFHEAHDHRFGWSRTDYPIEFLHWRAAAIGLIKGGGMTAKAPASSKSVPAADTARERKIVFDDIDGMINTPVLDAVSLSAGIRITGPAVIDGPTTTVLISPGDTLAVDERGNLIIDIDPPGSGRAHDAHPRG